MNSKLFFLMFIAFGVFCAFAQAGRLTARDHDDADDSEGDNDSNDDDGDDELEGTRASGDLVRPVSSFTLQVRNEPSVVSSRTTKRPASFLTDPAVSSPARRVK